MARIEIKLLINNIIFKTTKIFFLNNINTIFYKYTSFIQFFKKIAVNVVVINNSMPNSFNNYLVLINIITNVVIDSNLDNFRSNKKNYLFNNCSFLSKNNFYKNNINSSSNRKFGINLVILIKNCIQQ